MKKHSKKLKNHNKINKRVNIKAKIEKRYKILMVIILGLLSILLVGLFYVQIVKNTYYVERVESLTNNIVAGNSAPRGRIYDRNGNILVDNEAIKVISYKRQSGVTTEEEIKMSYVLAEMIEVEYKKLSTYHLKNFWLKNNYEEGNKKITEEEWQELEERKITSDDILKRKIERITDEDLSIYKETDKEAAYIYYLMNNGYSYQEKVIKKDDVTDIEYAKVAENSDKLKGFYTSIDWNRVYPYGNVFRTILGSVSTSETGIPADKKDEYLSKGYRLNDRVGLSYLEYQYEELLKGEKDLFKVESNSPNTMYKEGTRGYDLVLTIDIELQKEVEKILEEQMLRAKKSPNTGNYNRSFVIISDPNTGEILAMAGKQIIFKDGEYKFYDYTPGVFTTSVVAGSSVKGVSQLLGYQTGNVKIGEVRNDACLKIAATPQKCSWKYLGNINDIEALKYSSNTYQYRTAIKIGGGVYLENQPLAIDTNAFTIYRDAFKQFGLGTYTGIDMPNEGLGYQGRSTLAGHLLDFSIGQYDTYTPIQLSQYINTLVNGKYRVAPHLLKAVYEPTKEPLTKLSYEVEPTILNELSFDEKYIDRVKLGFKNVMSSGGTGYGYIDSKYLSAGKTGTSQEFVDTNNDKKVDTETLSHIFVGYAPYDNPVVTFTVVSPNIHTKNNRSSYTDMVNKRITQEVSKKFFEIFQ